MKILIIGGNRFVGMQVSQQLSSSNENEVHIINRSGQSPHSKNAIVHKGDRRFLSQSILDKNWDVVLDFACFSQEDAQESLDFFQRVQRYILISTASVYEGLAPFAESDFPAEKWSLEKNEAQKVGNSYQFGKRQAEALFFQKASFPVVAVRFPFILGLDDYTGRLEFHIDGIKENKALFFPNSKAKLSLIDSSDAAKFIIWCIQQTFTGPINVASSDGIRIEELIALIERETGKKAILAEKPLDDNQSPYGVKEDFYLSLEKLQKLGFQTKPLKQWLPHLIQALSGAEGAPVH